jgi:F-type H+-transporting ATPase subunit c
MKRVVQIVTAIATMGVASAAMANEAAATTYNGAAGNLAFGAAIAIAIAAFGGAIGQGIGIKSALESIGRNPSAASKITTPMIIGLAMIESLVIYALVIALMLVLKI